MNNNFCKYLTNQVRIEYGKLRPCCWFTESVPLIHTQQALKFQEDIKNIVDWNSAKGRCDECRLRESKGLHSLRLESLQRPVFDGVVNNAATSIEIQIDRDCNGACLICGPWNSTTWEKYENKIRNIPVNKIEDPAVSSHKLIDEIVEIVDFSDVKEILFLGGEPLRTDSHLRVLKNISNPRNVTVKYITNGSYRPDSKTLSTWARFKEIAMIFSIDAIEDQFNYLRWPLQWHQVENNLQFLRELPSSNIKIKGFSYTTTPFSLFYHDRYDAWAANFFNHPNMFSKPWQPRGKTAMKLSAIPPELQKAIVEKYGKEHAVSRLLEPYSPAQYKMFVDYIKLHDIHRQLDWRTVFPEMQQYFK